MFTQCWYRLRPLLVRGSLGLLLCAPAFGQESRPNPNAVLKAYTSRTTFQLPVEIDAATRATLKAIKLYVKTPEGNWVLQEAGDASQTGFGFKADRDGEYWFHIVTVDTAGKHRPSTLENVVPNRAIVVDTRPPGIWHDVIRSRSGEYFLRINIRDANPDYDSLRVAVQANPGQPWVGLARVADTPDLFRIVDATMLNGSAARISAADKVGLTVSTEVRLAPPVNRLDANPQIIAANSPAEATLPQTSTSMSAPLASTPAPSPIPAPFPRTEAPAPFPMGTSPAVVPPAVAPVESVPELRSEPRPDVRIEPPIPAPALPKLNLPEVNPNPQPRISILPKARPPVIADVPTAQTETSTVPPAFRTPEVAAKPPEVAAIPPAPQTQGNGNPRQQIASTEVTPVTEKPFEPLVAPAIDKVGHVKSLKFPLRFEADGATKLEFWATRDLGRTWQVLKNDSIGTSPAMLDLPTEGLYAIAILDAGQGPPKANAAPDYWVEADATKPLAVLTKTAMGEGADEGTLMISWIAQDRNIADKPISLYYQTKDGTTWAPIAKGLAQGKPVATEGSYRWKLPANLGSELTIRLDAVDRAGNVGSAVSGTVHLDRYGGGIRVIGVRSGQ